MVVSQPKSVDAVSRLRCADVEFPIYQQKRAQTIFCLFDNSGSGCVCPIDLPVMCGEEVAAALVHCIDQVIQWGSLLFSLFIKETAAETVMLGCKPPEFSVVGVDLSSPLVRGILKRQPKVGR